MSEPDWVVWARRLAAIAQNGVAFSTNAYDTSRYLQVREVAAAMLAAGSGAAPEAILPLLAADDGYITAKVDVRGVCFRDGEPARVLLVRERDDGLWTMPGGWADPTDLPSVAVEREVAEEAGYRVRAARLLACWDRTLQEGAQPHPWRVYKLFFGCDVLGETPRRHDETSDVAWFPVDDLPPLSTGRVTVRQVQRLAELHRDPTLPADFH
ncbi:MAG: NUDIX hydrolase [Egibacteraceae bacterium]